MKIKKLGKKILSKYGYDITNVKRKIDNDLTLYEKLFQKKSLENKLFYNIGAGGFYHPYWTNIDNDSQWYAANSELTKRGIQYDLLSMEPLPLDSNTAEIFYTSHTIEHITDNAAQFLFEEVYRVLKPGGIFRLITPNIDLAFNAFIENDFHYFYNIYRFSLQPMILNNTEIIKDKSKASIEQLFLHHFAANISTLHNYGEKKLNDREIREIFENNKLETALNYCTSLCSMEIQRKFPGNHINWWNKEKIFHFLKKASFNTIWLSAYAQSKSPVLRNSNYFDNTHPEMSIYVEAIK